MRPAIVCAALAVGLMVAGSPTAVAAGEASPAPPMEELLTRLAQAPAEDRARQCADCFADCGNRYGKACSLLCQYASPCWSLCVDRRRDCNAECNEALSCRARRRSCTVEPGLRSTALP